MTNDAPAQASGVEAIARIIDDYAFKSWQSSYDYEMKISGDVSEATAFADWSAGKRVAEAREKAAAILASLPPATVGAGEAVEDERERLAKIIEGMLAEPIFAKSAPARMAIAIAARNVRRGRTLTAEEKLDNLAAEIEEDDPDLADRLRQGLRPLPAT
ncbi:hypothetical protein [Bosea sp. (in: a-proteobacteria)]|uniref:hypothetical protein n=1 Tax=Bosea sp. (in: a-proteobacteria) TaxID=1871050 RepID=UPI003B3BA5FA